MKIGDIEGEKPKRCCGWKVSREEREKAKGGWLGLHVMIKERGYCHEG